MRTHHPDGGQQNSGSGSRIVPILVIAIYLVTTLLVDPRGEFPLNDDWAYTRSAFGLAAGKGLHVDEWAAPSLVGQSLYGGVLTSTFGQHFLVLRLSTLALSCGIAILLWFSLGELGVARQTAWISVLTWVFNPVQFCLSFTFMTEIPFLFFIMAGFFLFLKARSSGRRLCLLGSAVFFGYAYLIRQTALLFVLAGIIALLAPDSASSFRIRIRRAAVWGLTAGSLVVAYHGWIIMEGGATPATLRKLELLSQITSRQLLGNLFGLLYYVAFMLTPIWILLVPALGRHLTQMRSSLSCPAEAPKCLNTENSPGRGGSAAPRRTVAGVVRAGGAEPPRSPMPLHCRSSVFLAVGWWLAVACLGLLWFRAFYSRPVYLPAAAFHEQMPFLLNILYDTGLGPITLDPTYYGAVPTPVYPRIWLALTIAAAGGLVVLGTVCTLAFRKIRQTTGAVRRMLLFLFLSFAGVTAFEVLFSHQEEGGLFDRHILSAVLPALMLVGCLPGTGLRTRADSREEDTAGDMARLGTCRRSVPAAAGLAVLFSAWFCVAATHDYLSWNRLRWELGSGLLREGVDPLVVSGGFEFNAWHNYDTFRARGNIGKIYYWWYDDLEFLIAMEPQERYRVRRKLEYLSWVHLRNLPVYLLQRDQR